MLKEITRTEAIDLMAKQEPVYMIYELSMEHTIEDILGADGFVIEAKEKPGTECPAEEPRNEVNEVNDVVNDKSSEVKTDPSEKKKKSRIDADRVMELKGKGYTYRMIAQQLGCSEWSVCQIVNKAKKEGKDAERVDN